MSTDDETEPIDEIDEPKNDPGDERETETGRDDEIDDPDVESGNVSDDDGGDVVQLARDLDLSPDDADDVKTIESVTVETETTEPDDDDEIVDDVETEHETKRADDVER
jgi:hypothetical protein